MATINSITFNDGSTGTEALYAPGDPIVASVDFTPDAASVNAEPNTLTVTVSDSGGNQLATSSAPFTVNTPVPSGDVVAVSDSGGRSWSAGTVASDGGTGEVQAFSATA